MSYRTSQIKLNYPNKVLGVSVSSIAGTEYWPFANGTGDLWYEGSASPKFYRWEIVINITAQNHGSHLTRDDFQYNGLDVIVGDWLAGATDGRCVKVISISAKTKTTVTCVVEDWLRYNTFSTSTGNGIFGTGAAVVFSLNETGFPMLDPLPTTVASAFYATVMSRFQYLNPQSNYVLEKENHGFIKGDVIAVTSDGYVRANSLTASKMIGVISESGPGPNYFMISPNNRIIDFDPGIPGSQGDEIYVDADGRLSNTVTASGKVVFLNIKSALPSVMTGDQPNPEINNGYTVSFNNYPITFQGTSGGVATVSEISDQINTGTSNHNVVATVLPFENQLVSNSGDTIYGLVGGYAPFSAYFDTGSGNTLVNFTSNGSVYAGVSTPEDMAADISAMSIANLVVSATESVLTLTELNGNAIIITNDLPETGGFFFVGDSSISGLPAITPATNANKLQLTRADGGEVLIYEDSDLFQTETGIFSAHTGSVALAMNIEQGVRTGGTTVVGTVAARDALAPAAGDQAYVTNKGDGEWGLYLYTGSEWMEISNADSATTDAKTLTTTFTMPAAGFGNSTTQVLGNISPGRKITTVSVESTIPFSGFTGVVNPNVEIGTVSDVDLILDDISNDLTDTTIFYANPEFVYPNSETQDLSIRVRLNHYQSSVGSVVVKLTYI